MQFGCQAQHVHRAARLEPAAHASAPGPAGARASPVRPPRPRAVSHRGTALAPGCRCAAGGRCASAPACPVRAGRRRARPAARARAAARRARGARRGYGAWNTGVLQTGQGAARPCCRSQGSTHASWKWCRQGSVRTTAPSSKSSRHTLHVPRPPQSPPPPCRARTRLTRPAAAVRLAARAARRRRTQRRWRHPASRSLSGGRAHPRRRGVHMHGQRVDLRLAHWLPRAHAVVQAQQRLVVRLRRARRAVAARMSHAEHARPGRRGARRRARAGAQCGAAWPRQHPRPWWRRAELLGHTQRALEWQRARPAKQARSGGPPL